MALYHTPKCIGGRITEPLHEVGVADHYIYELKCIVDADDYAPITIHTAMSSAAAAGVDQLPTGVGPDAAAFFVGDSDPTPLDGFLVQFTRRFATIPASWSEPGGSQTYEFPGYFEERPVYVTLSDIKITHTYQAGASFTLPAVFQPTQLGFPVKFLTTGSSPTLTAYKSGVAAGNYLVIDAKPKRYLGNIYEIEKHEIKAK